MGLYGCEWIVVLQRSTVDIWNDIYNSASSADGGGLVQVRETPYKLQDVYTPPTSTNLLYIGREDRGGNWVIEKIDTSSGVSIRLATAYNNVSYNNNYSNAWDDRLTLIYGIVSEAFS